MRAALSSKEGWLKSFNYMLLRYAHVVEPCFRCAWLAIIDNDSDRTYCAPSEDKKVESIKNVKTKIHKCYVHKRKF